MACPQEDMAFWPANLWPVPLSQVSLGVIPIIWSTGSLPNPAGGDPDPWLGRRIPDRFEWIGNSVELTYSSGWYERGLCLTALPKIKVLIQGFCLWGVMNMTVTVVAGNRMFHHHMKALNGNDGTFSGSPLVTDPCGRKYQQPNKWFQVNVRTVNLWLRLCAEYCLDSRGTPGPWWQLVEDIQRDPALKFRPCEGCEYGFMETPKGLQPDSWDDLQLGAFLPGSFPLERNSGMRLINLGCPNKHALVVDTATGDADKYMRLPVMCGDTDTYARSELFISNDCFLESNERELPDDNDPRWVPERERVSCDFVAYRFNDTGSGDFTVFREGYYPGYVALRDIPRDPQPGVIYSGDPIPGYPEGPLAVWPIIAVSVERWTKQTWVNNVEQPRKFWTVVREVGRTYMSDDFSASNETRELYRLQNNAIFEQFAGVDLPAFNANNQICGGSMPAYDAPRTPPLLTVPKEERNDDLDGNCFIQGDITIGIKYSIDFVRVFRKLGPGVQNWAIRKIIPKFVPTSVKIPFKFRLPQGQSKLGDVTANITGTFIEVSVAGKMLTINIEEIFAYYNLADDMSLIGMLIPGPVGIGNLSSFCEV